MNQKIQELAREALSWFEYRTWYWAIKDGAPEWVHELAWVVHDEREILPDDFRYLFIVESLEAIAENPEEPESLLESEAYTSQLIGWLEASPSYRMGLVDAAVDQFGWSGLFNALQAGQLKEKEEVLGIVKKFLENQIIVNQFLENKIEKD